MQVAETAKLGARVLRAMLRGKPTPIGAAFNLTYRCNLTCEYCASYNLPGREMGSEEFRQRMRQRNAIEGTISELVRGYGMRRTRYRGLGKTRLANCFIGAACNVARWARLASWQAAQAA